jgi:hypothetical protein
VSQLGTKLLLILLVAVILLFGTADPFTTKHLAILLVAVGVVVGTPMLKALLIHLHIW